MNGSFPRLPIPVLLCGDHDEHTLITPLPTPPSPARRPRLTAVLATTLPATGLLVGAGAGAGGEPTRADGGAVASRSDGSRRPFASYNMRGSDHGLRWTGEVGPLTIRHEVVALQEVGGGPPAEPGQARGTRRQAHDSADQRFRMRTVQGHWHRFARGGSPQAAPGALAEDAVRGDRSDRRARKDGTGHRRQTERYGDGTLRIRDEAARLCLAAPLRHAGHVTTEPCDDGPRQRWTIVP
ncbi:hypothetical protein H340_14096 [Streptomyces mobaraensis NBRC 13819 = DSM 40847]|uniref:Ricin B lectin domain-containing protein n=2 Tax=Streptomyces mobaraensis TaxID=35621 RepID=M3A4E9_STRM1|nr:hypothetical protein H340_14096 [Streptomyces mobaraensis NBRC 13819 = DSM 40847]